MARAEVAAERSPSAESAVETFLAAFALRPADGGRPGGRLVVRAQTAETSVAQTASCAVAFEGVLHNAGALARDFSLDEPGAAADLVAAGYARLGPGVLPKLRGTFALVLFDPRDGTLLCARDPLGLHALFYGGSATELYLSSSVDAVARQPGVSQRVNRPALADHLCHRWPVLEETYYESVKRVPPGHALAVRDGRTEIYRYWQPAADVIDWMEEDEVERFEELFDQSIARSLTRGRAAVYLSGGLDSVSVAAVAADSSRRDGLVPPLALSLVFEHPSVNEESTQRRVAEQLGLEQELLPMSKAVGPGGLFWSALEMSATSPAPMLSLWNPAYHSLGLVGRRHGCKAILTGSGGDEWLGVNILYAADLLLRLDVPGLYRLWASAQRSYDVSPGRAAAALLWEVGMRAILRRAAIGALRRAAPGAFARERRRRLFESTPAWVAPDEALRRDLADRHDRAFHPPDPRGFYVGEMRRQLDSPVIALQLEELFHRGRRLGVPLVHPFWDADLAAFLYRMPPKYLLRGDRTKGLVRDTLARRFADLGFREHRKLTADDFFRVVVLTEGRSAWERLGGAAALAEAGIVDRAGADAFVARLLARRASGEAFRLWYLLSLEAWLRSRI